MRHRTRNYLKKLCQSGREVTFCICRNFDLLSFHSQDLSLSPAEGRIMSDKMSSLSSFDSWQFTQCWDKQRKEKMWHVCEFESQIWSQNTGFCLRNWRTLMTDILCSWHFCTGGGFVCDVNNSDNNMAVTLIKPFAISLCTGWWSLSSWNNDYLQCTKSLNKGAAGKVWYCSCLSRSKYVNRVWPTFHHASVSLI